MTRKQEQPHKGWKSAARETARTAAAAERKVKCTDCNRMFRTQNGMKDHWRAKHAEPEETSFASRLIDAQLEVAMGGYAADDLVDHLYD